MFTEFEPMVFKVSGEIQGIEVDLARLVMAELGRTFEVKTYRFAELIPALEANKIDVVMSAFSVTEDRLKRVDFTMPYMEIGQMAIVRLADASKYGQAQGLFSKGLRIGVHQGTTGEILVRKSFTDATVVVYGGVESALEALREEKIDVFVHDSTTSWQLSRSFINDNLLSLNRFLSREDIAWAVRKEDQNLLSALNLALEKLKSEGKVNEVIRYWLPVVPMTAQ
ncbi:MAG: ABC transporter substrate-binding protein [Pseudomonadales bacterium]|jgi:polar amino acid transport system substrate-binding protein